MTAAVPSRRRPRVSALALLALLALPPLLAGCESSARRAATAALRAEALMQTGDLRGADRAAREAIALRDDIADYWLLLGRVDYAAGYSSGAYEAYQRVLELDRWNLEALNLLGQMALARRMNRDVNRYADQLLLLNANDRGALVMKAGAALQDLDHDTARGYIDRLLTMNPDDADALVLKARLYAATDRVVEAGRIIEQSLARFGDPTGGLLYLRDLYRSAANRRGLVSVLERLGRLRPADPDIQVDLADMLFQGGQGDRARAVIAALMRSQPDSVEAAGMLLELLREEGPDALPPARMAAAAEGLSLEMRSVLAGRAADLGRPDVALAVLGPGVPDMPASAATADAQAAYGRALAATRRAAAGRALIDAVLDYDETHPRALLARGRLTAASGNLRGAIGDARRVVADDPLNVTARLLLADWLIASGERELGESALREGVRAVPASTRLGLRLAGILADRGDRDGALDVISGVTGAAPTNLRAWRARAALCRRLGNGSCVAESAAVLGGGQPTTSGRPMTG